MVDSCGRGCRHSVDQGRLVDMVVIKSDLLTWGVRLARLTGPASRCLVPIELVALFEAVAKNLFDDLAI